MTESRDEKPAAAIRTRSRRRQASGNPLAVDRIFAAFVDQFCMIPAAIIIGTFDFQPLADRLVPPTRVVVNGVTTITTQPDLAQSVAMLPTAVAGMALLVLLTCLLGRTPGKRVMKLAVVAAAGGRIARTQVVFREFVRIGILTSITSITAAMHLAEARAGTTTVPIHAAQVLNAAMTLLILVTAFVALIKNGRWLPDWICGTRVVSERDVQKDSAGRAFEVTPAEPNTGA
jgi:uncharacterized RDD family membrane protein YckC